MDAAHLAEHDRVRAGSVASSLPGKSMVRQ
jgi:hypothetical protein